MVNLVLTDKLRHALDEQMPGHGYTTHVPHTALSELHDLQSLLKGSRIHVSPPAEPSQEEAERKRVFRASMDTLAESLKERDYQAMLNAQGMTGPLLSSGNLTESSADLRILRNQISTIANVALSIFTAAMAAWYWLASWPLPHRILACLGSALALGCIEVLLYLRYVTKVDQAKAYDKRIPSRSIPKEKKGQ
jgi:hypothetical protein